MESVLKYWSLRAPIGCMTFRFPTKPYNSLGIGAENFNRQKEMNVVRRKVVQPEPFLLAA
jgi:hypothetical protein